MTFSPNAAAIWADGPVTAPSQPDKTDIRKWGAQVEATLDAVSANGGLIYTSRAFLFADLTHAQNTSAWVTSDPVPSNNGIYQKSGASGVGSWSRVGELPYSFIIASDAGAGTPNAIQATTSISVGSSALVWLSVFETNTSSPVTISFNGDAALTVKTNGGNDPIAGGLVAGTIVMGIRTGSTFRLVSDQASAAILAACEAAEAAASDYADFARNNWVVNGPFTGTGVVDDLYPLTINPGSANNMFPIVGGVAQLLSTADYGLAYVSGAAKIKITVPLGVLFEVRISNAVPVGTPADGSITEPKHATGGVSTRALADKAGTYAKIQDVSATARLLGRKTAGAGVIEELSATDLLAFLPTGSLVGSSPLQNYTTNANITGAGAVIPADDTIPQITEGVELISVSYTPKSTTNKLRIRARGLGALGVSAVWTAAIFFSGSANALGAGIVLCAAADARGVFTIEVEYVPGVLTAQTISLRVGVSNSAHVLRMNGYSSARELGGAQSVTLVVEEIKA